MGSLHCLDLEHLQDALITQEPILIVVRNLRVSATRSPRPASVVARRHRGHMLPIAEKQQTTDYFQPSALG